MVQVDALDRQKERRPVDPTDDRLPWNVRPGREEVLPGTLPVHDVVDGLFFSKLRPGFLPRM